jgi:dipeptidyl aminopeptidase/acylaminoacyl peptidase
LVSFGMAGAPPNAPAWSPDGQSIAVLGQTGTGSSNFIRELIIVQIPSGSMRTLAIPGSSFNWSVAWLDTHSLIINHGTELGAASQLWRVALPDGRLLRFSNDLNDYDGFSLTEDHRILATGRRETRVGVWVGDGDAGRMIEAIPTAPFGSLLTGALLAWAGDSLLYTAMPAGQVGVMSVVPNRDGLPHEFLPHAAFPSASSDGHTIVFQRGGLWKVDGEGRNPARLASDGFAPAIAPDGRHVIFLSAQSGIQSPWILPIDGGTPIQILSAFASVLSVDVSPDSQSLVFSSLDDGGQRLLVFCSVPTCTTKRMLTLPSGGVGRIRWTVDGRGVAFIDAAGSNIWIQALDGRSSHQVTHFDDGRRIADFAWSRDGSRLAIARASTSTDIVLFKGLRR